MRFGSVQFFKVLIKTVLAVVFFAPLIVAVILGVFLVNKNKQIDTLEAENKRVNAAADYLVGSKAGTAEDLYTIVSRSDIDYNEFLALLYKNDKLGADDLYSTLSEIGVSDKDIISIAASKNTVNGEQFYEIMTKNGITDKDLVTAVINKNGSSPENLRALLKACGLNDAQIAEIAGVKPGQSTSSDSEPSSAPSDSTPDDTSSGSSDDPNSSSDNPPESDPSSVPEEPSYRSKYPDMYVTAPANYVSDNKTVYLTFDDGPSKNIGSVLWILRQRGVKATFFVSPGQYGSEATARLKSIAADGHAIGLHSYAHEYDKIYASVDAFLDDFYDTWMLVYNATGIKTGIFRFPGGSNTDYNADTRDEIIAEMTRRGFRYYDWNVQSNDILGYTWTQMWNGILTGVGSVSNAGSHAIVLFHDRSDGAVNVLDDIIGKLLGEGYKFDKINDNTAPIQFVKPIS